MQNTALSFLRLVRSYFYRTKIYELLFGVGRLEMLLPSHWECEARAKKNHDFNWIFFYDLHIAISSTKLFHGFTLLSLNRCWQLKTQSVSHRFFIRLILTEYFYVLYKKILFHPSVLKSSSLSWSVFIEITVFEACKNSHRL